MSLNTVVAGLSPDRRTWCGRAPAGIPLKARRQRGIALGTSEVSVIELVAYAPLANGFGHPCRDEDPQR
jgi:hypothetical protein